MQLATPISSGTIAGAIKHLSIAQGAAADVSHGPLTADTPARLTEGIQGAKVAAAELFTAEPRSPYQDLVSARSQVIEGQRLLEQAASTYELELPVQAVEEQVQKLAHEAFLAFEDVYEILYND